MRSHPAKVPRIGFLWTSSPLLGSSFLDAFRQGLSTFGYVEGQNIALEHRYAEGRLERLPHLAAELVQLQADVIVTQGTPAAQAAKHATSSIPIITTTGGDPIGSGLVASLARPGGNITGLSSLAPELSGKRLELLKEAVPGISRVAVLWDAASGAPVISVLRETQVAAQAFGLQLHLLAVQGPDDFESAFGIATRDHAEALLVLPSPILGYQRKRLVDLAAKRPAAGDVPSERVCGGWGTHGLWPKLA
jgi:putative ABC transport system substrate-binding protein